MTIENTPESSDKIYKVWHTLRKNGKQIGHHITDLQFDEGIAYAVLEWLETPEGQVPSIRVPLDPKYLKKFEFPYGKTKADYLYENPVVWPER